MSELPKPSRSSILVVDDDVWNARMVSAILENAGYRVIRASDPLKALPLLRLEPFSLVLLDQNMPGMDGLTLLGEIRKESEVPVVMLTATDRSDLAVRALRLGAYDYLTKPVTEQRLLETVPQAIGSGIADLTRIAHYEIEREVGRGGMGVVYAARDTRLGRSVALKVLLPELAADRDYEEDFLREAQIAARFSHPNIVTVYEAGRHRGRLFIAMELVQGQTLQGLLQTGPALPPRRTTEIGLQVASALEAVHAAGMLHGDLKPANIMITSSHTIKILDFGLVRPAPTGNQESSSSTRSFSGTLSYLPPEVLSKGKMDYRGDVYALGVVLYELLAGVRAFDGETEFSTMFRIVEGKVARPWTELTTVPAQGVSIVRRMMAPAPEERFPTMAEARTALEGLLQESE